MVRLDKYVKKTTQYVKKIPQCCNLLAVCVGIPFLNQKLLTMVYVPSVT